MKMAENLPSVTSSLDTYSAMGEFSRQQIYIFLFFFPENRIDISCKLSLKGDNLHEMSNPIFWEK